MGTLQLLSSGALLFSLGVAGGSLLVALRSGSAATASRGMWLCLGAVIVMIVLGAAGYFHGMSIAFGAVAEADAATKATVLAKGISEAMNCVAFIASGTLPVALVALILLVRAKRLRSEAVPAR